MITRWDPFAEIARLQDQMTRWTSAGESPSHAAQYGGGVFNPAVDVYEEEKAFVVKAEVPGLKADDVHITVENDVLTVRGERKLENEKKLEGYHRIERSYGSFTRSFTLPKTLDAENLEADMADGILTVRIPKRAAPEPKRIQVRTGGGKPAKPGPAS